MDAVTPEGCVLRIHVPQCLGESRGALLVLTNPKQQTLSFLIPFLYWEVESSEWVTQAAQ